MGLRVDLTEWTDYEEEYSDFSRATYTPKKSPKPNIESLVSKMSVHTIASQLDEELTQHYDELPQIPTDDVPLNFREFVPNKGSDNIRNASNRQVEVADLEVVSFIGKVVEQFEMEKKESKTVSSLIRADFDAKFERIKEAQRTRLTRSRSKTQSVLKKIESSKQAKIAEQKRLEELKRQEEERRRKEEEERKRKAEEEKKRKEEEERKRKEEEERKRKEEKQRLENERLAKEKAKKDALEKAKKEQMNKLGLDEFQKYTDFRDNIRNKIKTSIKSPENKHLKSKCFQVKRKLNPKLGQLTNSQAKLRIITVQICEILNEAQNLGNNDYENALAFNYVLYTLTKLVVSQCESEVGVSVKSGVPLARLCVYLVAKYPIFEQFLMAKMATKCPYILGYNSTFETIEGRRRMGWKFSDKASEKFESELSYNERVGGIYSVYVLMAAVRFQEDPQILNVLQLSNPKNFVTMAHIWKSVARYMNGNVQFLTNSHFFMFCRLLECIGEEIVRCYGIQGCKLIHLLCFEATAGKDSKEFPFASTLQTKGEEFENTGHFEKVPKMID